MTIDELAPILRYVQVACGVRETVTPEQTAIWFDLLKDLESEVVRAAIKQVVIDHPYPNLPPVGVVRKAAIELMQPTIPAAQAWQLFLAAVRKFGSGKKKLWANGAFHERDNEQAGLDSLPPQVRRAARAFGWLTLCNTPPDELSFAQEQFRKSYASLGESEQRNAIMPPAVKAIAASIVQGWEPKALEGISQ